MGSDEVRRVAARVQQLEADVRQLAEQALAASVTSWRSTAAATFRRRLADEADRVRAVAAGLDDAAAALSRHAASLEHGYEKLGGGR